MSRRHRFRSVPLSVLVMGPVVVVAQLWSANPVVAATGAASSGCGSPRHLDPRTFPASPAVTNRFLPWVPGTEYVLQGTVSGASHRLVTTVTDLTKVVDGVRTIVLLDRDLDGPVLQEQEIFFNAQDSHGAVWNIGEYPELYDNGMLTGAPSTWIAGEADGRAGIHMLAHPNPDASAYAQGLSLSVGFDDCAKVVATGQRTCVAVGCFDDVLVTDEWAPNAPADGHQRKFYAPGVGVIRVEAVRSDAPEVLELTSVRHLCGDALEDVRTAALKQDHRAYSVQPSLYGGTDRAQRTLEVEGCTRS